MSRKLFAHMGITATATAIASPEMELALDDMRSMDLEIAQLTNEIEAGAERIEMLFETETLLSSAGDSADCRSLASKILAHQIYQSGADVDTALSLSAGMESEGSEAGVEAWSGIKDSIKSLLKWLKEKWVAFKRILSKYWNKYLGALVRAKSRWEGTLKRVKAIREKDYVVTEKGAIEIKSGAEWLVLGVDSLNSKAVLSGGDLATHTKALKEMGARLEASLKDLEIDEVETCAGFSEYELDGVSTKINAIIGGSAAEFTRGADESAEKFSHHVFIPGRRMVCAQTTFVKLPNVDATAFAEKLVEAKKQAGDLDLTIKSVMPKDKDLEMVKANVLSLDEIEALADANIALCDQFLVFKGNKQLSKLELSIDKAVKGTASWIKELDSDASSTDKDKVKAATNLAVALINAQGRFTIKAALAFTSTATSYTNVVGSYCKSSMARYGASDK